MVTKESLVPFLLYVLPWENRFHVEDGTSLVKEEGSSHKSKSCSNKCTDKLVWLIVSH